MMSWVVVCMFVVVVVFVWPNLIGMDATEIEAGVVLVVVGSPPSYYYY